MSQKKNRIEASSHETKQEEQDDENLIFNFSFLLLLQWME